MENTVVLYLQIKAHFKANLDTLTETLRTTIGICVG